MDKPSKKQIAFIRSLRQKKVRKQNNLFVAEGTKTVPEFLNAGFEAKIIVGDEATLEEYREANKEAEGITWLRAGNKELGQISSQSNPNHVVGVFRIPTLPEINIGKEDLILALDRLNDPGNMGTIIRTADWFGISTILCSADCVDAYNPKVVQSSMGSLSRVNLHYVDLEKELNQFNGSISIYGMELNGTDITNTKLTEGGIIVMGSESHGISEPLKPYLSESLFIPSFGGAESLNVAIATAIACSEFRRKRL